MRIHGMCVVRNEADVIEQSLRAAARWCDRIYVLDNGSDDGTWERVQELARELPQVVPFGQDPRPFDSGIREEILRHHAGGAGPEDWWCILDADEFYVDDPREFLARVPRRYRTVWKQDLSYYFTDEDLEAWRRDPSLYADTVPVEERLRYYSADWSEIRFFRHPHGAGRPTIPWDSPRTYPRRIRLKHFQYRSPEQIQKRLDTRRQAMERGSFPHEKRSNWAPGGIGTTIVPGPAVAADVPERWEERVVPSAGLHYDARDGTYAPGKPWTPPPLPGLGARLRSAAGSTLAALRKRLRGVRRRLALRRPGGGA
jgi:hypothetical protein